MSDYGAHVVMDLHTTNGTHMGYHLTYAPGLSPNGPASISDHLWNRWLPDISAAMLAKDDMATYHYGNTPGSFGESVRVPRGWYSFSGQPRYATNYIGLTNRYAVLSEAYSYASFADRIRATKRFVEEVLAQAHADAAEVRRNVAQADAERVVGRTLALRSTFQALPEPVEILLGEVDSVANPYSGSTMLLRRDVRTPERMAAYLRFAPTETETAPALYAVGFGPWQAGVRELLDRHGITYELGVLWGQPREAFVLDSARVAARPFQDVRMQEAFGRWQPVEPEAGPPPRLAPALLVTMEQPLARLIFALLEPRSDDGVVAWGLVPVHDVPPGEPLPLQRVLSR
jgi:hypothetical protein